MAIEHYKKILKIDTQIKNGTLEPDGRPPLSETDIEKITEKINGLTEKRDELLKIEKDYVEVRG